jgi:hypothetical protein
MAETLYGESRSSTFWKDGLDGHFLSEALDAGSGLILVESSSSHEKNREKSNSYE